jgi:hypothetical protein
LDDAEYWLDEAIKKFHRERRWQFSDWWEKYCSPNARGIYAYLSDKKEPVSRRELTRTYGSTATDEAIEILLHVGIVKEMMMVSSIRLTDKCFINGILSTELLIKNPNLIIYF